MASCRISSETDMRFFSTAAMVVIVAFASCPMQAAAATYRVEISNESPYCVSVLGVADGIFLRFPGRDPHSATLKTGKSVIATYEQPRPAKTIEVQGGPCTPTSSLPRKFANNRQAGHVRNAFRIVPGPNETILVKP